MDRRNFLKSVTGAAAAATASGTAAAGASANDTASRRTLASPPVQSGKRRLRLALAWPDNTQGFSDFCRQFTSRVAAISSGALTIDIVASAASGFEAVSRGEADCYFASEHAHRDAAPELSFFAGLPGRQAMDGQTFHNWLSVGGGQALWDQVAGSLGIKALAVAHSGPCSGLWSQTDLNTMPSLTGKTLYAEGLAQDVVRGLGGEVYDGGQSGLRYAFASGEVFAAEVGGIALAVAAGLPRNARYYSRPGINRHGLVAAFGMRAALWEAFSDAERSLLEAAAAQTYNETLAFASAHDKLMTEACRRRHQVICVDCDRELQSAIDRVGDIVVAHIAAGGERAQHLNASYMAFARAAGHRKTEFVS